MKTILYRRWAPAQSSVKIEFSPDLIHDIRAQSLAEHDRGYLFGWREGAQVRVATAIRVPQADDPCIAGLEAVGVYFVRARGEVFLTDSDLEQTEQIPGGIAFVIAGRRAGFFTPEPDGSMRTVRSHEEFLVADAAPQAEPLARPGAPPRGKHPAIPPTARWKWALGLTALLGGPAAAFAFFQPRMPQPPVELVLRETNGQLVIRWDPHVTAATSARLEITEGEGRTLLPVPASTSSATYAPHSGDVEVRLATSTRSGRVYWTSARFVPPPPEGPAAALRTPDEIRDDLDELQNQAEFLRHSIARRTAKVEQLAAAADKLLDRP